jgi:hypothetical protein
MTDNHCNWIDIFLEQMNLIDSSRLISALDTIKITAISQGKLEHKTLLLGFVEQFSGPKYEINFIENPYYTDRVMLNSIESPVSVTENATMRRIYNDALNCTDDDYAICYIHNKGITRTINNIDPASLTRYYYWRQFLNHGVIEKWKENVDQVELNADVSGVNYQNDPSPHYSGSFWWTKASHIRKLPDPATLDWWKNLKEQTSNEWLKSCSDRFRDEMWVCSIPDTKANNLIPYSVNPASTLLKKSDYI